MRVVYVLCLWIMSQSATIHSPVLKVISCFTHAADATDKVSPYWLYRPILYAKFRPYSTNSDPQHSCLDVKGVLGLLLKGHSICQVNLKQV